MDCPRIFPFRKCRAPVAQISWVRRHAPFVVSDNPNLPTFRVRNVAIPRELDEARAVGRRDLRNRLDQMERYHDRAAGDPVLGVDENYQQAVSIMNSAAAQRAFDMEREPNRIRDAYGRTTFGQQALLARRLVEAGVPFITLYSGGWDHHADIFQQFRTRGRCSTASSRP